MASKVTKKSAVNKRIDQMGELRNKFDEAINALTVIVEAEIKHNNRIDRLAAKVSFIKEVTGQSLENIEVFKEAEILATVELESLLDIRDKIIPNLKFGHFQDKDMVNPVDDLIPGRFNINTIDEMLDRCVVWNTIRPYGERIENIHRLVIEGMEAIENGSNS